jgi:hypothetical protein
MLVTGSFPEIISKAISNPLRTASRGAATTLLKWPIPQMAERLLQPLKVDSNLK